MPETLTPNYLDMMMMRTNDIATKLTHAARFSNSPIYSLFSYRDNDWTLVATLHNADDMASEYVRYAVSGQWGNCLEIRCNGVRVSLSDNVDNRDLKRAGGQFIESYEQLACMRGRLMLSVDTPKHNNESIIRIELDTLSVRLEIVRDHNKGQTRYDVEKPLSADGCFASFSSSCSDTAVKVFAMAIAILDDIRTQLDSIG